MRALFLVAATTLLAGCQGPADSPGVAATVGDDHEADDLLRDLQPDSPIPIVPSFTPTGGSVLSFPNAGLYEVRLSVPSPVQWRPVSFGPSGGGDPAEPPSGPRWALVLPRSLENISGLRAECAPRVADGTSWGTPSDEGTNATLPAGEWTLLAFISGPGKLELRFADGRSEGGLGRTITEQALNYRVTRLEPIAVIESDVSPFRRSFEETFETPGRGLFLGYFGDGNSPYLVPREMRTQLAAASGTECAAAEKNFNPAEWGIGGGFVGPRIGGPAAPNDWAATRYNLEIAAWTGTEGRYSWSGFIEADGTIPPASARSQPLFAEFIEEVLASPTL